MPLAGPACAICRRPMADAGEPTAGAAHSGRPGSPTSALAGPAVGMAREWGGRISAGSGVQGGRCPARHRAFTAAADCRPH